MFIYRHRLSGASKHLGGMVRKRKLVHSLSIRLTEPDYRLILDYQRENGHATMSAAVRDMIHRQGRYSRWKRARRGREAMPEPELRRHAKDILHDHPEATKSQLGYNLMKRAGKLVDAELIKRIVDEMAASG